MSPDQATAAGRDGAVGESSVNASGSSGGGGGGGGGTSAIDPPPLVETPAKEVPLNKALGQGSPVDERLNSNGDVILDEQQHELDHQPGGSKAHALLSRSRPFRALRRSSSGSSDLHTDVRKDQEDSGAGQKPEHEEHPANRGPMWASRPDQEQRDRINKLKKNIRSSKSSASTLKSALKYRQASYRSATSSSGTPSSPATPMRQGSTSRQASADQGGLGTLLGGTDTGREGEAGEVVREAFSQPITEVVKQVQEELEVEARAQQEGGKGKQSADGTGPASQSKMLQISHMMRSRLSSRPSGNPQSRTSTNPDVTASGDGQAQDEEHGDQTQQSEAHPGGDAHRPITARARWTALKRRITQAKSAKVQTRKLHVGGTDVTQELQSGILPVFMLKMSLERDENKKRRIPVLLNHVRLKITDSVNPLSTHAVFRIELEYGDGLVKWVIYRELKDFINLHTHYRAAALRGKFTQPLGTGSGGGEGELGLPSFPRTSLPYFTQLQRQGKAKKAEFAAAQREALEKYIIELMRRTMFRAEANRLCKFFEISALSVSLASRGGFQGKQGYLRILSNSSRKSEHQSGLMMPLRWVMSHDPKWFIVRESFIAMVDEPDSLQIHDVFLMDTEFEIIRPKRILRQGVSLAQDLKPKIGHNDEKEAKEDSQKGKDARSTPDISEDGTAVGIGPSKDKSQEKQGEGHGKQRTSEAVSESDRTALLTGGQFRTPRKIDKKEKEEGLVDDADQNLGDRGSGDKGVSTHTFYIKNSERKLRLVAKNERQMHQFIASMETVAARNVFTGSNRFGSFAPIRLNVNAQWLVDGRDYYWNLSKALLMAKDRIFIHDWWLSPELYLRRPGKPKWRLDNVLKKKAEEGVKIFVILYNEVSNSFTPTDSNYTKQRLIGLHRNIYVQRSPSHIATGTFMWAHHEKLCVIDETVAFMGGLDLCFGRWDTSAHVLVDDADGEAPPPDSTFLGPIKDGAEARIWPGQDYANERVLEWHTLNKPEEDLFSREKFPRMPWHDTGLQLVGQPARDLCRHFIQRWNYLLRIKNHSRVMPFLVPPPDFTPKELLKYGLTGTVEAQICRSCGPWSMGTPNKVEHSIQNAYLKAIQMSEHFVYIENQFFITSTTVDATKIENQLGDALVNRIIRAHREGTHWRAVIVIPLIPGFPLPIDHPDASSVRLIVECQYRAICRGEHSIFGRLRREGIAPEDYISFFSLRTWGMLKHGLLTTEQVYIHGKIMIVDDRLTIIGSANINERSQRGDRDSELACVLRDTDMIDSTMAGEPFKVGRFNHTLRVRLMREHLGIDCDAIDESTVGERSGEDSDISEHDLDNSDTEWDPENEQAHVQEDGKGQSVVSGRGAADQYMRTLAAGTENLKPSKAAEAVGGMISKKAGAGKQKFKQQHGKDEGGPDPARADQDDAGADDIPSMDERLDHLSQGKNLPRDVVPTVEEQVLARQASSEHPEHVSPPSRSGSIRSGRSGKRSVHNASRPASVASRHEDGTNSVKRKMSAKVSANPWSRPGEQIDLDSEDFKDPISDDFYLNKWMAIAARNTQIYRKVFKCVPDDTVTTWGEYKAFLAWSDRLSRSQKPGAEDNKEQFDDDADHNNQRFPAEPIPAAVKKAFGKHGDTQNGEQAEGMSRTPSATTHDSHHSKHGAPPLPPSTARPGPLSGSDEQHKENDTQKDKKGAPADPGFSPEELRQMEDLLDETQGHLVVFPTRWLEKEGASGNLLFPSDVLLPLNVYD